MAKVLLAEGAAPSTPASGYLAIYATTGGAAAFINDGGTTGTFASHTAFASWTPTLQFGGAAVGMTFTTQVGTYVRVGNLVFVNFFLLLSAKGSSTGTCTVGGLPFAAAAATNHIFAWPLIGYSLSTIPAGNQLYCSVVAGASALSLRNHAPTAALASLTDANFGATSTIHATGVYITSGY